MQACLSIWAPFRHQLPLQLNDLFNRQAIVTPDLMWYTT